MSVNLSDFEAGTSFNGDYAATLAALQERLARIQVAHIVHRRCAIVVFEGWDASGKGGAIKRMCANLDPRGLYVFPIAAPTAEEKAHHFLWRFWNRLPGKGEIAVFDRSWYGRVLVERVEGYASEPEWRRAYDELNEFEARQRDDGMTIVKLFLHITQDTQNARIKARLDHPWKRWKTGPDDFRNRARRADYDAALADMFAHTDTRWAPWKVIDGNDKKAARIAALIHVADVLERAVPMTPPEASEETIALAARAFSGQG